MSDVWDQEQQPMRKSRRPIARRRDIFVLSVGFLSDAYDLFIINLVLQIMRAAYSEPSNFELSFLSASIIVGTIIGQIAFGRIADKVSRQTVFLVTGAILIVGAILSATADKYGSTSAFVVVALYRAFMGLGIGGEYPLCSTIASELNIMGLSPMKRVAAVFSFQGLGNLLAPVVVLIALKTTEDLNASWRIALGFGALPCLATYYWRVKLGAVTHKKDENALLDDDAVAERMEEAVQDGIEDDTDADGIHGELRGDEIEVEVAALDYADDRTNTAPENEDVGGETDPEPCTSIQPYLPTDQGWKLLFTKYKRAIFATTVSWFLFDITFYGNGLFTGAVVAALGLDGGGSDLQQVEEDAKATLIIAVMGLPGYYLSLAYIDKFGYYKLQCLGFVGISVVFLIMGIAREHLVGVKILFLILYGLTFFFSNFGPNVSTFVAPTVIFPSEIRSTAAGISAAAGKAGALLAALCFKSLTDSIGEYNMFLFCSGIGFLGLAVTVIALPKPKE